MGEITIRQPQAWQTTEAFAIPSDATYPRPVERLVGVPLKSYKRLVGLITLGGI